MLLLLRFGLTSVSKVKPLFRPTIPSLVLPTLLLLGVEGRTGGCEWEAGVVGVAFGGLVKRELEDDVAESNCERNRDIKCMRCNHYDHKSTVLSICHNDSSQWLKRNYI